MTKENVNNQAEGTEEVQEEAKEEKAVVNRAEGQLEEAASNASIIQTILESTKQQFLEANAGLDLDFVYIGDWLKVSKKGDFVERDDEDINYGDSIDVVIAMGEKRWTLFGEENSPEDGQLLVAEQEQEDAEAALGEWLMTNPEAAERYNADDLELRYVAYVVPVESLTNEFPQVYLISFPKSTTIGFGKWTMQVFKGKYKDQGVPSKTGINKIVTRMTTVERKGNNFEWIGIEFDAVGMFNPEEYGINTEEAIENTDQ